MTNRSKDKGDRAELEVQAIFRDEIGVGRRAFGAGRKDDIGDISGIPHLTVQVANYKDVAKAVRHKPVECEEQRIRAGTAFGATFVRLRGTSVMPADYRVVLTVEQFMTLYREAAA